MKRNKNFYKGRKLTLDDNIRWKIIITCIVLTLGILALMPAVSGTDSSHKFYVQIQPLELDISDVKFHPIEAYGHYNYGEKVVEKFPLYFDILKEWSTYEFLSNLARLNENLSVWSEDADFDDYIQEMNGIRDALGLYTTEKVLFMGEKSSSDAPIEESTDGDCTATAATGEATHPEDLTFLHQNIDTRATSNPFFNYYEKHVFISKIEGENKYAFFQVPVFREYSFLNEKGVGFGGNSVALNQSFDIDSSENDTSMPIYWLWRQTMMEAENVDDVEDLWYAADRAAGLEWRWPQSLNNMNTMWVDSNDGILAIEQMNTYFAAKTENPTWPGNPDILWITNHHRWNDSFATGSNVYSEGDMSYDRNARAYKLLNDTYRLLDYDKFYSIASDHGGGLDPNSTDINDICRHGGTGNSKTVFSWIIEPDPEIEMFSWIGGSPCFHEDNYHNISFTDLFTAEESGAISMSSYSNSPMGYYFQTGSIPYLINSLGVYDYFLYDFAENDDYLTNLTAVGFLSDLMNCDLEQLQHEYTVSWTNDIGQNDSDLSTYIMLMADGVVNASIGVDDPVNNTWTTIQKAIDNSTNLGIIIVNNGTYSEDVIIDKSIILFGEDKNNVTINGSITMINPHDYELINFGEDDIIQNVNMTGLEALFHFNNDTRVGENYSNSSVVFDYSGQQNNGTNNNASLTTSTIKGAGAFMFNGINSSINLSSISALTGDNVTVSAWINWQGGSGTIDPIVSQSESSNGYMLYVNSSSDKPAFRLNDAEIVSTVSIDDGWHNIVGTYDEQDLKLYVDGVFRGNTSIIETSVDVECFIGYDNDISYFNGTIDEVAVWNRTLSDTEISHIYDQHYGVTMDGFTVQNSNDIGISIVNHTDLTNFIIKDHVTGVKIDNVFDVRVSANFSNCNSGIEIKDCSLDEYNKIHLVDCNFEDMDNGVFINSSDYVGVYRNYMNCTGIPMQINNCDINTFNVVSSTSKDNVAPDTPSLFGSMLGTIGTSCVYSAITNDTDDDQLWYYFDWDDGNNTGWIGPYLSNEWVNQYHSFEDEGGYYIRVKTKDVFFNETDWDTILFRTETLLPLINSVNHTPDPVGFGYNVIITANVTDDMSGNWSGIKNVKVNITYPDDTSGNFTMNDIGNNIFEYTFCDTWLVGQYNYTIWAVDNAYNTNSSSGHSFNVSAQCDILIETLKDDYGSNEYVNITDPPEGGAGVDNEEPQIGYELLDDNTVLHIWNKHNSYYFNTSSGIQLTNYYNEYWSHNVMMLGYYNNDEWNLLYRTDELSGFNKDIDTDNETYVDATLWKDLSYSGYDFRLALRYHLGVDDSDLTIIPYIKNLGQAIPYDLAFGWEINDIKIANTTKDNYLQIYNGTGFEKIQLNQMLDRNFTDMDINTTINLICTNPPTKHLSRNLYLSWDNNLTYKVTVKSRPNQYNAPVTLFIKIGMLGEDQSKSTELHWLDSDDWLGVPAGDPEIIDASCCLGGLSGTNIWYCEEQHTHYFILYLKESYLIKNVRGRSDTEGDPTNVSIYVCEDAVGYPEHYYPRPDQMTWGDPVASGIDIWQDATDWVEVETVWKNGNFIKVEVTETEGNVLMWGGVPSFTIFDIYGDMTYPDKWLRVNSDHPIELDGYVCCGFEGLCDALDGEGVWGDGSAAHAPNGPPPPWEHWFVLDFGTNYTIGKVRGRSDSDGVDPENVSIYISDNVTNWGDPVATGIDVWNDTKDWVDVYITRKAGQYMKVVVYFPESFPISWGDNQDPFPIFDVYGHKTTPGDWLEVNNSNIDSYCGDLDLEGGHWGCDIVGEHTHQFTLDLGKTYRVSRVHGHSDSDCDPTNVDIYVSDNLEEWGNPVADGIDTWQDTSEWVEIYTRCKVGRYVKVAVHSTEEDVLAWCAEGSIFDVYVDDVNMPTISNPYPDGDTGVSLSPTLSVTINDVDGDPMNITWYTNASGTWTAFRYDGFEDNGTYYHTFTDADIYGEWWYWKVKVNDGTMLNESRVYKFFTGNQSKIKNTGSTDIKGYLLMQVQQYYDGMLQQWVIADDTINETNPRTINASDQFGLDTVFNGLVNTNDLSEYGSGMYRVYAALRDPDENILKCDDETYLETWYEFDIIF